MIIRLDPVTRSPILSTRQTSRPKAQGSYILHERARSHFWEGKGLLSIKTFLSGSALYKVGGGHYRVDPESYLVLNHDQRYTVEIDSGKQVESFCLFFEPGFAEEVKRSLVSRSESLLDTPTSPTHTEIRFFERTYPKDLILSPSLERFRCSLTRGKDDPAWIQEEMHFLMQRLLQVHDGVLEHLKDLPSVRAATREELYRRIWRARDYASACFQEPIRLSDLARVACLSPNHLLRSFKQVFGQTPHQFVISRRLREAQRLLLWTDMPVTEICFAVGFESLGSFSWLFRRRLSVSPENYRRQKGDFREAE